MDENQNGGASTENRGFGEVVEREYPQDAAESEDTQNEQVEDDSTESSETDATATANQEPEVVAPKETGDETQEPTLTEKGTKLDPNPQSAVHQQLANERKMRTQMEQVLASPELIAKFVKDQYGIEIPTKGETPKMEDQPAATSAKKWTAKDFESLEDVADKFNSLQETLVSEISKRDEEIGGLKKQLGGITETSRMAKIADTIESDIAALRSFPELNPNNPEFIPGLEDQIGALYHKFDFDEKSGYRGAYSLRELGETIINTARTAKKAGSQQAQTIVKDKTQGTIRTTPTTSAKGDTDNMSPGNSIAAGIAKMFSK